MKKRKAVPENNETDLSDESEDRAISFVVRIWKETGPSGPEFRGWIEHVQSRHRDFFLALEQLPSIIAGHIGIPPS